MTDELPAMQPEPRSRVQIWRGKEGEISWTVAAVAGEPAALLEDALERALAINAQLQEMLA